MSDVRNLVGDASYEAMRQSIRTTFPDASVVVSDAVVDLAFQMAKHDWAAPELANVPIPAPPACPAPSAPAPADFYLANATHERVAAPGSLFTGHLPLVRVRIPDKGTRQTLGPISTAGGDVLPDDRLNASVDVLWATYGSDPLLKFGRPERVDFIGAPRLSGARFGAISLYLCFAKQNDPGPSFYILEAGLATGQPRMPFLGRTMDAPIVAQTQYTPTAFSAPSHFYRGKLAMQPTAPAEPQQLVVEVFKQEPPNGQYLRVTVDYVKLQKPVMTYPFGLTIQAAARISAIADALGVDPHLQMQHILELLSKIEMGKLFIIPPHKQS